MFKTARTLKAPTFAAVLQNSPSTQMDTAAMVFTDLGLGLPHTDIIVDVNECMMGSDRCAQNCNNTVGNYTCSCNEGYTLNRDGNTCDGTCELFSFSLLFKGYIL